MLGKELRCNKRHQGAFKNAYILPSYQGCNEREQQSLLLSPEKSELAFVSSVLLCGVRFVLRSVYIFIKHHS